MQASKHHALRNGMTASRSPRRNGTAEKTDRQNVTMYVNHLTVKVVTAVPRCASLILYVHIHCNALVNPFVNHYKRIEAKVVLSTHAIFVKTKQTKRVLKFDVAMALILQYSCYRFWSLEWGMLSQPPPPNRVRRWWVRISNLFVRGGGPIVFVVSRAARRARTARGLLDG